MKQKRTSKPLKVPRRRILPANFWHKDSLGMPSDLQHWRKKKLIQNRMNNARLLVQNKLSANWNGVEYFFVASFA